jgi:hypothetical protein
MFWTATLMVVLLWGSTCPQSYARSKERGHFKLVNPLSIVICLIIPMVATLIQLEVGFGRVGVPATLCLVRNDHYLFYAISVPISVVGAVSLGGFVIIGWNLIKVR